MPTKKGMESAMIRPARAASVAKWHALVALIERSQIRLPKPLPGTRIPYEDEVDVAIIALIASHVRGVPQPIEAQWLLSDAELGGRLICRNVPKGSHL
jgi:hypothetical protein